MKVGTVSERLRAKREELKPKGGRAFLSPPSLQLEAADTIDALVAALEEAKRMLDGAVLDDRSGLRKIDAALALARGGK
ncbi:hypothetical protein LB559_09430 [Mesorhizobium sp. BR1-1-3]|uniref:hypothetical protein n=1 Tax=Mesorhizobium sp. BR1-1-3 TaxID=2876651 RepID=UPI001CD0B995|nr:hypothetical protein [Mesorhizobium sp. BR1-1-3]MBZ9888160.1 hypothetical protein [Mesorhizobium sp. BR1-1-3]